MNSLNRMNKQLLWMICILGIFLGGCGKGIDPVTPSIPQTLNSATQTTASAATVVTQNVVVPIHQNLIIPCPLGGGGEIVVLYGRLHLLFHASDTNGVIRLNLLADPQNVLGVGQATGTIYHATGVTRDSFTVKAGVAETYVNNFHIVGPGLQGKLIVHENLRIFVDENDNISVRVNNWVVQCI